MGKFGRLAAGAAVLALTPVAPTAATTPESELVALSTVSGSNLAALCTGPIPTEVELDPCNAYILGAVDALQLKRDLCMPMQTMSLQSVAVARKHIRATPEEWHLPAIFIVRNALSAFRCK